MEVELRGKYGQVLKIVLQIQLHKSVQVKINMPQFYRKNHGRINDKCFQNDETKDENKTQQALPFIGVDHEFG